MSWVEDRIKDIAGSNPVGDVLNPEPKFEMDVIQILQDPNIKIGDTPIKDLNNNFRKGLEYLINLGQNVANNVQNWGLNVNIRGLQEQLEPLIKELFAGLKSVLNDFAYLANGLLSRSKDLVQDLISTVFKNISDLVSDIGVKVKDLLDHAESLGQALIDKINTLNNAIFKNLRDFREALFVNLNNLLNNAEAAADRILYKGRVIVTGTIEQINSEFDAFALSIQSFLDENPFSSEARKRKEISEKIKKYYSIDLIPIKQWGPNQKFNYLCGYNLIVEDYEIENKKGDERIGNIVTTYADLQDKAWRLSTLGREDSSLSKVAMKNWIKYGQLYELWDKLGNEDKVLLDVINDKMRELDEAKDKFKERSAQIESLKGELQNISTQLQNENTSAQINPFIAELQRELQYISAKLQNKDTSAQINPLEGVLQKLNLVLATSLDMINK